MVKAQLSITHVPQMLLEPIISAPLPSISPPPIPSPLPPNSIMALELSGGLQAYLQNKSNDDITIKVNRNTHGFYTQVQECSIKHARRIFRDVQITLQWSTTLGSVSKRFLIKYLWSFEQTYYYHIIIWKVDKSACALLR